MKNILPFILISLLVWNSNQDSNGMEFVNPLSLTVLNCLAQDPTPIDFIIIRIYKISGTPGVDQGGVQTFVNAGTSSAYFSYFAYVEICRSAPPTKITTDLKNVYPRITPFSRIFVKVTPNSVAGCTWTGYTRQQNCDYLTAVINSLRSLFLGSGRSKVHIYSTVTSWKSLLGTTCNNLSGNSLLWYAEYNSQGKLNTVSSFGNFI